MLRQSEVGIQAILADRDTQYLQAEPSDIAHPLRDSAREMDSEPRAEPQI